MLLFKVGVEMNQVSNQSPRRIFRVMSAFALSLLFTACGGGGSSGGGGTDSTAPTATITFPPLASKTALWWLMTI